MNPKINQLVMEIGKKKQELTLLERELRDIQNSCEHKWEEFAQPHTSGYVCAVCHKVQVARGTICYTPDNCQCEVMRLPSEYRNELY